MRLTLLLLLALTWHAGAFAQTTPIDVQFSLLAMKDNYDADPAPVAGATVRLVLGEGPNWQDANAGRQFVTDAHGEARFTMDAPVDTRVLGRNIGFTPFSSYSRAEHLKIGVELEHRIPMDKGGSVKTFRWMLTMDLDCFKDGVCSTVGFMNIYVPDAQGRFSRQLARQGGTESWKVPELNDQVMWGMSYKVADFRLESNEKDPKERILKLAIKRLPPLAVR